MGDSFLPELVILLPARDEEIGVSEVIDRIPTERIQEMGYSPRVVVVDGHSSDSTCEVAKGLGAEVIEQNGSIGKGNGVRQALEIVFQDENKSEDDLIIMLDADATYGPEEITKFLSLIHI